MSLITQCPACATMFRVVPDQLRISEGWVRCGHCDEVFDANAHLRNLDESASPVAEPPSHLIVSPEASGEVDVLAPHSGPEDEVSVPVDDPFMQQNVLPPEEATSDYDPLSDPLLEQRPQDTLAGAPSMEPVWTSEPSVEPEAEPEPEQPVSSEPSEPATAQTLQMPALQIPAEQRLSFMPLAPARPSVVNRLLGPGVMALLSTVLAVALGMQFLLLERDRLAATVPALRPALMALCGVVGCTVSAPRQIEAIAIDSSTFSSVKPGVYLLSVTLKNAAALDVTAPALELTLTDMQDRALLRRVIASEEYGVKQNVLGAGAEVSASLPISVHSTASIEKIAGYKLLAFYP